MEAVLTGQVVDGDLVVCAALGMAWQADPGQLIDYGPAYFEHYRGLEGSSVATRLNAGRCALLARHAAAEATVLDFGAGSGEFVRHAKSWGFDARGFDINPATVAALREMGAYGDDIEGAEVVAFWDSLEHLPDPGATLRRISRGAVVLVAIPVFSDLAKIRESKHYKPGEHLWYFTPAGFVAWMVEHGFDLMEESDHETRAGRDSIAAFAFRRVRPQNCPCGGTAHVECFDWPGKPRAWFLRCSDCRSDSDSVTDERAAFHGLIDPKRNPG